MYHFAWLPRGLISLASCLDWPRIKLWETKWTFVLSIGPSLPLFCCCLNENCNFRDSQLWCDGVIAFFFFLEACPVYCRVFSSTPDFYPLDASIIPSPSSDNQKCIQALPCVPWEVKWLLIENRCNVWCFIYTERKDSIMPWPSILCWVMHEVLWPDYLKRIMCTDPPQGSPILYLWFQQSY